MKNRRDTNKDKTNSKYESTDAQTKGTQMDKPLCLANQHGLKLAGQENWILQSIFFFVLMCVFYSFVSVITKTCLYNVDPLKPHFHIVKLGFTGVNIIFLFLFKNIDCGYSLEPPR